MSNREVMRARAGARGYTLVEMTISAAILLVLVALSLALLRASTREMETEAAVVALETDARRALEIMAEEIRQSRVMMISPQLPAVPGWTSVLVFQEATGIVGMAPSFGPSITYAYQWNPRQNWGEITRTQGGQTTVLLARLELNGFRLERDATSPNQVTIRLLLQMAIPNGDPVLLRVETAVLPRN